MITTRVALLVCVSVFALCACQGSSIDGTGSDGAAGDDCPLVPSMPTRTVVPEEGEPPSTRVVVDPAAELGAIDPLVYGVNHRFPYAGFRSWDPEANEPHARFLAGVKHAGFPAIRFPGGRMANLYRWKRAIGPLERRGRSPSGGGTGQAFTNEFGPDELGRLLDLTGAEGTIVANFATGSPREAADWVEYMNTPRGENPNGGTAWADVRAANGHPKPYAIRYWEIGNEMNSGMVYWIGERQTEEQKARKYIFGGETLFERQNLGTRDSHSIAAAKSDGTPGLVRWVRYPRVELRTATLFVDDDPWERVEDLGATAAEDVYELDARTGRVTFGNGRHGNVPPKGAMLTISYVSGPHAGFLDFYAAMKEVDPSIEIGSAIHTDVFTEIMGAEHPYDFMVVHTYGYFKGAPTRPKDLHDYFMQLPDVQADYIIDSQEQVARYAGPDRSEEIHVALTEYAAGSGLSLGVNSIDAPDHYLLSLDAALYTALLLRHWVRLGIRLAQKHSLVDSDPDDPPPGYTRSLTSDSAVIGPAPCFIPSASAHVFRLYTSMMGATRIASRVRSNPRREIFDGSTAPALVTLATIDEDGRPAVLVINTDGTSAVAAEVVVEGTGSLDTATLWTLAGPSFLAYNTEAHPDRVSLQETIVEDVGASLSHTFPAHSVTAIRFDTP